MKKIKEIVYLTPALAIAVFLLSQPQGNTQQKTEHKTDVFLNQLPQGSVVAVSSGWENALALKTVPFSDLAGLSESDIHSAFKAYGITHLLLTSRDIYPYISVYGDSVSLVETDEGEEVFRYASQNPITQTTMLTESDNQLSGIYLVVDNTSNHLERSLQTQIKITNIVCEFLSENETLRLPPQEIFFKNTRFLKKENTCPYTVFIDRTNDNPFDWTLICVQPILRNSLAIKLYLLDEPSESFALVYAFKDADNYIKVWKIK